jgi:hypothetical protein
MPARQAAAEINTDGEGRRMTGSFDETHHRSSQRIESTCSTFGRSAPIIRRISLNGRRARLGSSRPEVYLKRV